ncbi:MFS transporter [Roseibium sp. RKSG952]|uniref:MFS transporter n=1 Tax=Roseibium sp. RKSG952 TaxID=2529384 RepID=UPI0012BD65CE|nr:MFS transporter [Roseibium sp. RKSG952]MTH95678.1 MFS transporter [Roseibium sp. RKSG952]
MTSLVKFTLLFVVFVDLLGQGLVFPIINTLVMEAHSPLLAADTPANLRHIYFGLVIGIFFLAWFFGAPYISKLSDIIGRKRAILICLFGAAAGYAITIASLYAGSLTLLIIGRAITGFTAGNQAIAQAAMIDGSVDDHDRNRNMGFIITGVSAGLVGGPIIAGLTADPILLGRFATLQLPFYVALALCLAAVFLVLAYFEDERDDPQPFRFQIAEVFDQLLKVKDHPATFRLAVGLFFFHTANMTMYVFVDNYLSTRFGYGTLGNSMVFLTVGLGMAFSSTFLVVPVQKRFSKQKILLTTMYVWALSAAAIVLSPFAVLCFVPLFAFYFIFGVAYPTILGLFSASVPDTEQGWVMGVTVAIFTFLAGTMSLIGGELMNISIRLPFYIVIAAALATALVIKTLWKAPVMAKITGD